MSEGGLVDANGWGLAGAEGLVSEEILSLTLVTEPLNILLSAFYTNFPLLRPTYSEPVVQ